jgi:hypothetical protein
MFRIAAIRGRVLRVEHEYGHEIAKHFGKEYLLGGKGSADKKSKQESDRHCEDPTPLLRLSSIGQFLQQAL